jgi:hypothetical protein
MTPLYGRLAQVMGRKGAMLLAVSLYSSKLRDPIHAVWACRSEHVSAY